MFLNKIKGWRTVIINALFTLLPIWDGVIVPILNTNELRAVIPIKYLPIYSLLVVVVNIWMRSITNTPLGRK